MAVSDFYIQATLLSETDLRGTITFVNDTFCEVSKYSREELIGEPHNIIRHPDTPKKLFELWWETIKRGEVFRAVIKNKTKDDAHYWVQATILPVKNKNGEVVKYIAARHLLRNEEKARELYDLQAKAMQL